MAPSNCFPILSALIRPSINESGNCTLQVYHRFLLRSFSISLLFPSFLSTHLVFYLYPFLLLLLYHIKNYTSLTKTIIIHLHSKQSYTYTLNNISSTSKLFCYLTKHFSNQISINLRVIHNNTILQINQLVLFDYQIGSYSIDNLQLQTPNTFFTFIVNPRNIIHQFIFIQYLLIFFFIIILFFLFFFFLLLRFATRILMKLSTLILSTLHSPPIIDLSLQTVHFILLNRFVLAHHFTKQMSHFHLRLVRIPKKKRRMSNRVILILFPFHDTSADIIDPSLHAFQIQLVFIIIAFLNSIAILSVRFSTMFHSLWPTIINSSFLHFGYFLERNIDFFLFFQLLKPFLASGSFLVLHMFFILIINSWLDI